MTLTAKMDELGKPAWIAATVLGFVIWWPVGLATLAFVIWSGRMGCGYQGHWQNRMERMQTKMDRLRERMGQGPGMGHGSGFRRVVRRVLGDFTAPGPEARRCRPDGCAGRP